ARAGVGRRAAVVLAGLGDPVAFLPVLVLRVRGLGEAERDHSGDGGLQQLRSGVHGEILVRIGVVRSYHRALGPSPLKGPGALPSSLHDRTTHILELSMNPLTRYEPLVGR